MGIRDLDVSAGVPGVYVPQHCNLAAACCQANIGLLVIAVSSFAEIDVTQAAVALMRALDEYKGAALLVFEIGLSALKELEPSQCSPDQMVARQLLASKDPAERHAGQAALVHLAQPKLARLRSIEALIKRRCEQRPHTYWVYAAKKDPPQLCRAEFGYTFGGDRQVDLRGYGRNQRMIACADGALCVIAGQHAKHVFQIESWLTRMGFAWDMDEWAAGLRIHVSHLDAVGGCLGGELGAGIPGCSMQSLVELLRRDNCPLRRPDVNFDQFLEWAGAGVAAEDIRETFYRQIIGQRHGAVYVLRGVPAKPACERFRPLSDTFRDM